MLRLLRRKKHQAIGLVATCFFLAIIILFNNGVLRSSQNHLSGRKSGTHPKNARILCWALVRISTLSTKARALQDTWTRRCDKILFFSSNPEKVNSFRRSLNTTTEANISKSSTKSSNGDNSKGSAVSDPGYDIPSPNNTHGEGRWDGKSLYVPIIPLEVPEGLEHLTAKVVLANVFSWRMHGKDFDWFLKADDDTYIVMENLREMLKHHDPDTPLYFGYRFKPYTPQGYMSGGAGYVLSREALRRLVVDGILGKLCGPFTGVEDLDIGRCLYSVGVKAGDSLDEHNLERFHPLNFFSYFSTFKMPGWTGKYAYHPFKRGFACCSNRSISFHYIRAHEMYTLEFLIYHMKH